MNKTLLKKNNGISTSKANQLFWLGRYAERVYLALHLLRKHYDVMIDEDSSSYKDFCEQMGIQNTYHSGEHFMQSYLNDEDNTESIITMLERVHDNAMVIREEITSESLSYIQLSILFMKDVASEDKTMAELQTVTDYILAFWGSIEERIENEEIRNIINFGKYIESTELHIRFGYSPARIRTIFGRAAAIMEKECYICDKNVASEMEKLLMEQPMNKTAALSCVNNIFTS